MPLNIDIEVLQLANWPPSLVAAIYRFQSKINDQKVNQSQVYRFLKDEIQPLIGNVNLMNALQKAKVNLNTTNKKMTKIPTWNEIEYVGRLLNKVDDNHLLLCVSEMLIQLPVWCGHKNTGKRITRAFCNYCWRHVYDDKAVCYFHDYKNTAEYKKATRQNNELFYELIECLYQKDKSIDAIKHFRVAINNNVNKFIAWLIVYRPLTAEDLKIKKSKCQTTTQLIEYILEKLDTNKDKDSSRMLDKQKQLHKTILDDPDQILALLRRREAWLTLNN